MYARLRLFVLAAVLAAAFVSYTVPSSAQIVLVDNDYWVTEMRPGKMEFGVTLKRGEYTKNWVHVKSDTRISKRRWLGQGRGFVDDRISQDRLWNFLRLGMKVHVAGGRDWDGSVSAKRIWF